MSLGLYRLPTGGIDGQHPHSSDEVYIVQSGRARLRFDPEGPLAWRALALGPGNPDAVRRLRGTCGPAGPVHRRDSPPASISGTRPPTSDDDPLAESSHLTKHPVLRLVTTPPRRRNTRRSTD